MNFIEVETALKIKLCAILEQLNQRRNGAEMVPKFIDDCIVEEEEKDFFTQFLQLQKNQIFDLQEHFERYCNVLLVFGVNSAKNDINLIKSCLLPILLIERDIEPTDIKKSNEFVFFQVRRHSITGLYEFPRWCHQSWLFPQSLQDRRDKSFLSLRMVQLSRGNEQQRKWLFNSNSSFIFNDACIGVDLAEEWFL